VLVWREIDCCYQRSQQCTLSLFTDKAEKVQPSIVFSAQNLDPMKSHVIPLNMVESVDCLSGELNGFNIDSFMYVALPRYPFHPRSAKSNLLILPMPRPAKNFWPPLSTTTPHSTPTTSRSPQPLYDGPRPTYPGSASLHLIPSERGYLLLIVPQESPCFASVPLLRFRCKIFAYADLTDAREVTFAF
jgi:hypothetical protein